MKEKDCIFCKIIKKEHPATFVEESNNFIVIRDAHPKAEGHSLIIPKKHHVTLLDIPDKKGEELISLIKKIASDLLEKKKGDGFNILMNNLEVAGQAVMHAHLHIIPRKEGDGLKTIA